MLQEKGSKVANAQIEYEDYEEDDHFYDNDDGRSALMLATELRPVSKAIELIDALMAAGASMNTKEYKYFGHVFFHACRKGVDPLIFDNLIMWDAKKDKIFQDWWSQCDSNGHGVFVLACESQNISLAEHILTLAFTQHRQENFLESKPNHILKSLAVLPNENFDEEFMVSWLRLVRKYVDEIPQEYIIPGNYDTDCYPTGYARNGCTIILLDTVRLSLRKHKFHFIEEYAALFSADYKFKETIWRYLHREENQTIKNGRPMNGVSRYAVRVPIPVTVRKFALSYERSELWKRNKDISLVLLRDLKTKYQSDILEIVSSFIYTTPIDAKAHDAEKCDPRYCCECKSWYVGLCICYNFNGRMPGNPGSGWESWEQYFSRNGRSLSDSVKQWKSWNNSE